MDYPTLVDVYLALEKTSKRLEKVDIISDLLKKCNIDNLIIVVYLLQGRVFPLCDERKIGMSSRLILKAISQSAGVSLQEVEKLWRKKGDLGIVAEELLSKRKQTTLYRREIDVQKVFDNVRKLAETGGEGTVKRKIGLIVELLNNAKPIEARFIVRTVLDELRIGVADGILRDSIAKAYGFDVKKVERAFDILADFGEVAKRAKKKSLEHIELEVGKPFKVMLAIKVDDIKSAFEAVGKPALLESKIDGFRVTIHKKSNNIKLFTRRMENITKQFGEVIDVINSNVKCKDCILDSEFVGYDPKTKKYLPFQNISRRIKRKYNIEVMAKKFPVEINIFDIVHYNGKDLFQETQEKRRMLIEKIVENKKFKIKLTNKLVTGDEKEADVFFKDALKEGHEGLIFKKLDALYQPGRRVQGWVKLKSVLEPFDLTVTRCYFGEGKRAGWLTSYTLACKAGDKLLEIGKVSTGVKEKGEGFTYRKITKMLKPLIQKQEGKEAIVNPKIVIEVGYEEIQKSPTYSSGYALRFPKVLKVRFDKPVSEITTLDMIKKYYNAQQGKK